MHIFLMPLLVVFVDHLRYYLRTYYIFIPHKSDTPTSSLCFLYKGLHNNNVCAIAHNNYYANMLNKFILECLTYILVKQYPFPFENPFNHQIKRSNKYYSCTK